MRFLTPQLLWFLLAVVGLGLLWAWLEKRATTALARFASERILGKLLRGVEPGKRKLKVALILASMALVVVAIARPQAGTREETVRSEGLDIVFLFDVSNSMLTEDVVPSRLMKGRHIVKNFVDRLSGDRVGIVAFAGSAYPAVPLTTDYDFVRQSLEVLHPAAVSNQGTDLARAAEVGLGLLRRGGLSEDEVDGSGDANVGEGEDDSSASRVIVVLSDGESHEGDVSKLAETLGKSGVRVYSIGLGSLKGGPIPIRDENGYLRGYKKDILGNMILTRLESKSLEALAGKTGGKFYTASANEGEVEEILSGLSTLERAQGTSRRVIVYEELFQIPLAIALLCLLLVLYMRDGKRAHKPASQVAAAIIVVGALLALLPGETIAAEGGGARTFQEYRSTQKGVQAYSDKDFAGAARHFGEAQAANPDSPSQHMNLGSAMLKSGAAESAVGEFDKVVKDPKVAGTTAAKGAYNLGKSFEAQGQLDKALQAYQEGLVRLASDPKGDAEVELRIKRALEQVQNQKNQGSSQEKKDDKQQKDEQKKQDQDSEDKKDKEQQKPQISREKPKFKAEKLSEEDAKKILKQLQEQEKKTQQRQLRNKTARPKDDKNNKDW